MISKKIIRTNPIEVRSELQAIADELGLSIKDERVLDIWSKKGYAWSVQVSEEVMQPLYFPKKTMSEIREILEKHGKILPQL